MESDGGIGGGGDWWRDRYWCGGTDNAVIDWTPSLTWWIPLNGHCGILTIIGYSRHPQAIYRWCTYIKFNDDLVKE